MACRFKGQSFQLASFLIDLTACQSVSKVRVQVLVQVLTSFSVFHTLNELRRLYFDEVSQPLFLCCFLNDSLMFSHPFILHVPLHPTPPLSFLLPLLFPACSVSGLWVWVMCQSHPLGEEDGPPAGLRIGSHKSGRLVAQQAPHTQHTQWYVYTHTYTLIVMQKPFLFVPCFAFQFIFSPFPVCSRFTVHNVLLSWWCWWRGVRPHCASSSWSCHTLPVSEDFHRKCCLT